MRAILFWTRLVPSATTSAPVLSLIYKYDERSWLEGQKMLGEVVEGRGGSLIGYRNSNVKGISRMMSMLCLGDELICGQIAIDLRFGFSS